MKQMRKRVSLILISLVTMWYANAQTIVTVDGLRYSLSGAYASVYRVASSNVSETINVPSSITYEGQIYSVNAIESDAFHDGLRVGTSQGAYTYNCQYVKKIILPNTIETIGSQSFYNSNINFVNLEEGVISIGNEAFRNSSITAMVIPKSVVSFRSNAFRECNQLRTLIYLSETPPDYWIATSYTYVPNKYVYGNPGYSINNASIIEMITFSQTQFEYTGNAPVPTWTNNVDGYTASFSMPILKSEVGSYEEIIPVTFTNGDESFTANIPYTYTIEPVKLKAKVNSTSRTYGESNPDFTISFSGFVNGDNENVLTTKPTIATTANEKSAVGTYPITISGGEAKNYTLEYEQGELTVNKASLSIQVLDANKVYGNENPTFSLGYSGLKNEETVPEWTTAPKFTTTATKESGAGTYEVSVTCDPKNYTITTSTPGKLTIKKAPLTVKVDNATMDYCETMPTYSYTYSGFVNGDDASTFTTQPSIATEVTATSNAGTYTITPEGAQSVNYDFTYTAGTLTIKKRPLTVKVNSASRLYGEENPTFTVEYSGFVNNETKAVFDVEPNVSTTATIQSKAGTYDILVSGGSAINYALTYQNGQLTITPRPLKAFVGNYERPYGQDNPIFTIEYEGLVGNDTGASLTTQPMARTSATKTSVVGTYPIEVTGGYSPNYTLSYDSGILTIVKAEQTFTWDQDLTNLKVGDQVELQAYASSNLPITYTADSENYAEIYKAGSKTYLECKKAGSFHIKAEQEGNDNYFSTQRISKEVTIVGEDEYNPTLFIKQTDNGMVSTKVNKGSTYKFTIYVESGWKIHSVTFNDNDVTNELDSNNSFTTPAINENSTLNVVYEQGSSAINAIQNSRVKILATSGGIRVTGANTDDVIQVYTTDGVLQQSVRAENSQVEIPLRKDNVYVVKVGAKTLKLRL